jgi:glycosyltransferase involved in cell wall biosynthesis
VRELQHVGINAVFLQPPMGGLETYVRELVPELARLAPAVRFTLFCNPAGAAGLRTSPLADVAAIVAPPVVGARGLRAVSELTVLAPVARRHGVELLHSVALTGPIRTRLAHVVTIADATWIVSRDPGEGATQRLWRTVVPSVARGADRVIAISRASADHVHEHLRVPADRIDVVPLGHGTSATATPTPEPELRARLRLGQGRVVLAVSAKKRHKNLPRLVEAWARVHAAASDAILVLPGRPTDHELELRARAAELGIADVIAYPDYVSAEDLEGLYAIASVFTMPSVNEGFGLPILEAMRRGVPAVVSDASALPEVAGEAARYFDPLDPASIAEALLVVLDDPIEQQRLIAAGHDQQARFTWSAAAEGTLASFERAWAQHVAR